MNAKRFSLIAAFLFMPLAGYCGDGEFDRLVKAIESHYQTKPMNIPFMGVASFVLHVAHPEGASGVRIAVFEDLKASESEWRERDHFMATLSGSTLHPFVQVHSHRSHEATYIFMGPAGKTSRLLIANFERDQATVVEVKADIEHLLRSIEDPVHARSTLEDQ